MCKCGNLPECDYCEECVPVFIDRDLSRTMNALVRSVEDASKNVRLMHDENQHEVVCLDKGDWLNIRQLSMRANAKNEAEEPKEKR